MHIWRTPRVKLLLSLAVLTAVAVVSTVAVGMRPGQAQAAGEIAPAIVPASALTTSQLSDAYRAFAAGERGFQQAMNAIDALQSQKVAGVDLTAAQKDALRDQGLTGLAITRERFTEGLNILGVTSGQLDAYVSVNPLPVVCYETLGNCAPPE